MQCDHELYLVPNGRFLRWECNRCQQSYTFDVKEPDTQDLRAFDGSIQEVNQRMERTRLRDRIRAVKTLEELKPVLLEML